MDSNQLLYTKKQRHEQIYRRMAQKDVGWKAPSYTRAHTLWRVRILTQSAKNLYTQCGDEQRVDTY